MAVDSFAQTVPFVYNVENNVVNKLPYDPHELMAMPEVEVFIDKFLLGKTTANTAISTTPYNSDLGRWISW